MNNPLFDRTITLALLAISALFLQACTCEEEQMEIPFLNSDQFVVTAVFIPENGFEISVVFNRPVETMTAFAYENVVLSRADGTPLGANDFYQIEAWDQDNTIMLIEFNFNLCEDVDTGQLTCPLQLEILNDQLPLRSNEENPTTLDGDFDGEEGGNYSFIIEP